MKAGKPIKRNAAIVELSKDHHFALLLIWKIREGLKNSIEPGRISKYVIHFYENDLVGHFRDEEELLFIKLDASNTLRVQAETEHQQLHQLVDALRKEPGDRNLLEKIAATLEKHIRFEERVLFNHLQEIIPVDELNEIASALKSRENKSGELWKDVFWTRGASKV